METNVDKERMSELLELMEIPEVRQVIFAKVAQAKLIFSGEIKEFYKRKYPNLITFPRKEQIPPAEQVADTANVDRNRRGGHNRIEWKSKRGFFNTTRYLDLAENEQIDIFQEYFRKSREFRREILYEFFLKKMPYSDSYENAG
jgi:hypothetical protein